MDRDDLFRAVTYTHVALSGMKRSDHGLSLSRDRRSIVFGGSVDQKRARKENILVIFTP